jgi:hypothetical protein
MKAVVMGCGKSLLLLVAVPCCWPQLHLLLHVSSTLCWTVLCCALPCCACKGFVHALDIAQVTMDKCHCCTVLRCAVLCCAV